MAEAPPRALLHPLLRAVLYLVAFFVAQIGAAVALLPVAYAVVTAQHTGPPMTIEQAGLAVVELMKSPAALTAATVTTALVVLATTLGFRYLFDHRPFRTLGFQRVPGWVRQLAAGVALGTLFNALMAAVLIVSGHLTVGGISPDFSLSGLALGVALFVSVSVFEETAVRGYLLQVLEEWRGIRWAVLISTLIFASGHIANLFLTADPKTGAMTLGAIHDPMQATAGMVVIFFAGLLLAYCYVATRQLWLPIGLHFGWNFGMGSLLGFPVSNVPIQFPTLLKVQPAGHSLLTGGAFGLEGSVLALPAILVLALCVRLLSPWLRAAATGTGAAPT